MIVFFKVGSVVHIDEQSALSCMSGKFYVLKKIKNELNVFLTLSFCGRIGFLDLYKIYGRTFLHIKTGYFLIVVFTTNSITELPLTSI